MKRSTLGVHARNYRLPTTGYAREGALMKCFVRRSATVTLAAPFVLTVLACSPQPPATSPERRGTEVANVRLYMCSLPLCLPSRVFCYKNFDDCGTSQGVG